MIDSTADFFRGGFKRLSGILFALNLVAFCFFGGSVAEAGTIVAISPSFANSPGTGYVDLTLSIPTGDPGIQLGGFTVGVSAPANSGLTFTAEAFSPSNDVFGGNSLDQSFAIPFQAFTPVGPNQDNASDNSFPALFVAVNPGDTVGLARFYYALDPGLVVGSNIPVTLDLSVTFLADGNGNPITFDASNSQITVGPASANGAPEPASMTLLGFGVAGMAGYGWRRRNRAASA